MSTDTLSMLQDALHAMAFGHRRYLYMELQRRATASQGIKSSYLIAWPDVVLYLTPEIVRAAIKATYDAAPSDIRKRLETAG